MVGTDGSPDSEDAVTFAFEPAERTGDPLQIVYCWHPQTEYAVPVRGTDGRIAGVVVRDGSAAQGEKRRPGQLHRRARAKADALTAGS